MLCDIFLICLYRLKTGSLNKKILDIGQSVKIKKHYGLFPGKMQYTFFYLTLILIYIYIQSQTRHVDHLKPDFVKKVLKIKFVFLQHQLNQLKLH